MGRKDNEEKVNITRIKKYLEASNSCGCCGEQKSLKTLPDPLIAKSSENKTLSDPKNPVLQQQHNTSLFIENIAHNTATKINKPRREKQNKN